MVTTKKVYVGAIHTYNTRKARLFVSSLGPLLLTLLQLCLWCMYVCMHEWMHVWMYVCRWIYYIIYSCIEKWRIIQSPRPLLRQSNHRPLPLGGPFRRPLGRPARQLLFPDAAARPPRPLSSSSRYYYTNAYGHSFHTYVNCKAYMHAYIHTYILRMCIHKCKTIHVRTYTAWAKDVVGTSTYIYIHTYIPYINTLKKNSLPPPPSSPSRPFAESQIFLLLWLQPLTTPPPSLWQLCLYVCMYVCMYVCIYVWI